MENKNFNHISVRLEESIEALNVQKNKIYVDCTFGRGGHSKMILDKLDGTGHLFCFDQDAEAEEHFKKEFSRFSNCSFIKANFNDIKIELNKKEVKFVDGFIYDLGVSSPMFDNPKRGFSYKNNGLLDMRMDQNLKLTASDVINNYSKEKLINIFKKYGDIKDCIAVVENICNYRKKTKITSTLQLVEIIREKTPLRLQYQKKHFARTYFQALRIEVNNEIKVLENSLKDALEMLNPSGRIVTISFHSLEERTIKNIYKNVLSANTLPKEIPINNNPEFKILKIKNKPNQEEIIDNNRSRSAYLKVIERLSND